MGVSEDKYMWIIIFVCFMCLFLSAGITFSFGAFVVHFANYFDVPQSDIASIVSISTGCFYIVGPIYGGLLNKFSCRCVSICGSLLSVVGMILSAISPNANFLKFTFALAGIGYGSTYISSLSCITHYSSTKRGIVMGIVTSGISIGMVCIPPIVNLLFQIYALSGVMLIFSGITLNSAVFGALMRPSISEIILKKKRKSTDEIHEISLSNDKSITPSEKNIKAQYDVRLDNEQEELPKLFGQKIFLTSYGTVCCSRIYCFATNVWQFVVAPKRRLNFELLKDASFLVFILGNVVFGLAFFIPLFFLPHSAILKGIVASKAVLLISGSAIANIPGKLILGYATDMIQLNVVTQFSISLYISSVATVAMPLLHNYEVLMTVTCIYGFFLGCYSLYVPVIVVDIMGSDKFSSSMGIYFMFFGIAAVIGPPLAGFTYDVSGSYDYAFFLAGGLFAISATMFLFVPHLKSRKTKCYNNDYDT